MNFEGIVRLLHHNSRYQAARNDHGVRPFENQHGAFTTVNLKSYFTFYRGMY